ncbi:MAG: GNAT family N-acetyltransferase [Deltaproteobacteria bacterium]|nr:GNAT family N-acetyltransferase [Deltaproteobacteria bacterium]
MEKEQQQKGNNNGNRERVEIDIREMEIDDLATVFHMGEQLFKAKDVPNLYRTWDEYEVITFFQGDTELCLVAEVEGRVVGFLLGTTVTKSRSAWKYGLMAWLGVNASCRRHGVAKKLFEEFRDIMEEQGVRMLLVDTEADNEEALRFFEKIGFDSPEEHVYLSLNLATKRRRSRKLKKNNGNNRRKKT